MIDPLPLAYIDPGTGAQFFSSMGPLIGVIFATVAAAVLWPFRQMIGILKNKKIAFVVFGILVVIAAAGLTLFLISQ